MKDLKQLRNKQQLNPKTLEQLADSNAIRRMMTSKERQAFLQAVKKEPGAAIRTTSKIHPAWQSTFKKLSPGEQGALTTAIAALSEQGLSQMEIAKALSNVTPSPLSPPQLEKPVDERVQFD